MKKLFLLVCLPFIVQLLFAQNYILQQPASSPATSNIYQDANALIGIGTTTPGGSMDVECTWLGLPVLNLAYSYHGFFFLPGGGPPDFIFASNTQLPYEFITTTTTTTNFNVNGLGQVGIGLANEPNTGYGTSGVAHSPDLLIQTHGWADWLLTLDAVGLPIACIDDNNNLLFGVINNGTTSYSNGCALIMGNTNISEPVFAIGDQGGHLGTPTIGAISNGVVMMGTNDPIAQVDIINATYIDGSSMDYLFHVGDAGHYLTVANDANIGVAIGVLPTGYSTLAVKGLDGTSLDLLESNTTAWNTQLRFFGSDGNLRHIITDDVGATDNLIIYPGWEGHGSNVVEVEGSEWVTGTVTIGNYTAPTSLGSGTFSSALLSVDGQLAAKEIVVTVTSWSDTVFSNNYHLKSLSEVENYICQNHHLPDVPSEKDVIKDGISLGDMNKILLQKVEELTLYVMKQQKEIDELKNK